jgi:hypothetical protein
MKRGLMTAVSVSQQRTLGGGDIRRRDMPFVSNRMNFSKARAMVVYPEHTIVVRSSPREAKPVPPARAPKP